MSILVVLALLRCTHTGKAPFHFRAPPATPQDGGRGWRGGCALPAIRLGTSPTVPSGRMTIAVGTCMSSRTSSPFRRALNPFRRAAAAAGGRGIRDYDRFVGHGDNVVRVRIRQAPASGPVIARSDTVGGRIFIAVRLLFADYRITTISTPTSRLAQTRSAVITGHPRRNPNAKHARVAEGQPGATGQRPQNGSKTRVSLVKFRHL